MKTIMVIISILYIAWPRCEAPASTITYTYDKQHRLTEVSYSASQKETYSYDAANNLDLYIAITDAKYLKSFLMYLAKANGFELFEKSYQPDWTRIWANLKTRS